MPTIRPARSRRQVYLDSRSHIVVSSPNLDSTLYKISPEIVDGAPSIVIHDGSGRAVVTISVSALRIVLRYLPILFNTAERMARRSTTRLNSATVQDTVNNDDNKEG